MTKRILTIMLPILAAAALSACGWMVAEAIAHSADAQVLQRDVEAHSDMPSHPESARTHAQTREELRELKGTLGAVYDIVKRIDTRIDAQLDHIEQNAVH